MILNRREASDHECPQMAGTGQPADQSRRLLSLQSGHMSHPYEGSTGRHPAHPTIQALTCNATTHPMPTVQISERQVALSAR